MWSTYAVRRSTAHTYYPIEHFDPEWTSIPIGKPISHTEVYVLDEEEDCCLQICRGELCIGGCGVAKGYLNRKELTEIKIHQPSFRQWRKESIGQATGC